ncbi:MAG: hypothetical protein KDA91_04000 [Planctomycetaceae bacterium]|nr:hypothetical protein [Planctomycetaceae bacterium]
MIQTSRSQGFVPPAKPARLGVRYYETDDGIGFGIRNKAIGTGCFLVVWLSGWTVGCVVLIANAVKDPSVGNIAFGIPFWGSWLAVSSFLIWLWFGRETFVLKHDKALFVRSAIIRLSAREVPRSEILRFEGCLSKHTQNDQHLHGIRMVTAGEPLEFGFRLDPQDRVWILYRLNDFLNPGQAFAMDTDAASVASEEEVVRVALSSTDDTSSFAMVETLIEVPEELPAVSDNQWEMEERVTELRFGRRGQFRAAPFFLLLFLNSFWNGIVSVFVLTLWGALPNGPARFTGEWWFLFFFLIPFELIGLAMFSGLLLTVLAPFRTEFWKFDTIAIGRVIKWPFFNRSEQWEPNGRYQLQLRKQKPSNSASPKKNLGSVLPSNGFELAVVSDAMIELCSISNLTEGEARWIGQQILRMRFSWLRD